MPEYIIIYNERKQTGKPKTLSIFAPSAPDAWTMAPGQLPKGAKIVDIIREGDNTRGMSGSQSW